MNRWRREVRRDLRWAHPLLVQVILVVLRLELDVGP